MSWIDQRPDDAMDGAFMAVAPDPIASIEPPAFREAMSRLGAAVHVVTSAGPAGRTPPNRRRSRRTGPGSGSPT